MVSSVAMVPARVFLPVVLAGILGLMSGAADAQRRNQRPPPQSLSPDEAFVQARQLAYQNDLDRFDAVARAAAEHPLRAYLDYWRLRIQLNALNGTRIANGTANPSDVDAAVLEAVGECLGRRVGADLGPVGGHQPRTQPCPVPLDELLVRHTPRDHRTPQKCDMHTNALRRFPSLAYVRLQ